MAKKIYLLFFSLFLIAAGLNAQSAKSVEIPLDTIFKLNGTTYMVDVTTVTPTYVSFVYPGKDEEYTIERKEVHKIVYKTGRIEILNKAAFVVLDETSWEAVWVTEDKKDVSSLYLLGDVEARSPSSATRPAAAKKSALVKLKKRAANLNGTVVLVTWKEKTGGYGEYPGYFIKGKAYGPNPPEDETSEVEGASVRDAGM